MSSVLKRIVSGCLIALASSIMLHASPFLPYDTLPQVSQEETNERDILSRADADSFIADMLRETKQGNGLAAMMLAQYYESPKALQDGFIAPDLTKSRYYYSYAANLGVVQAYVALAKLYLGSGEVIQTLQALDRAYHATGASIQIKNVAASFKASVVLEYATDLNQSETVKLYQQTILMLEKHTNMMATSEFLLANLYNRLGYVEPATYYLSKACTNPSAGAYLAGLCNDPNGGIVNQFVTKRSDETDCPSCEFQRYLGR